MFDVTVEEKGVKEILEALTEEEKDILPDENETLRYFRAEKGNSTKAIKKIKYALQWRKDFGVDKLTKAFYEDTSSDSLDPELAKTRSLLLEEAQTGKMYVRGYDRNGRAVIYMRPRNENTKNVDGNLRNVVYSLERAIACTSKNDFEKLVIILDLGGWTMKNAVPLSTSKKFLHILQECYPERLFKIYICQAPLIFRAFWNLIKPFLDPVTKAKAAFCSGESGKKNIRKDFDETKVEKECYGTTELRKFNASEYFQSPMHLTFDETEDSS